MENDTSKKAFDPSLFLNRLGNDRELFNELMHEFLKHYPTHFSKITEFVRTNQYDNLYEELHSIKGEISNFEFEAALTLVVSLENLAKAQDLKNAPKLLQELDNLLQQVLEYVRKNC